jgi:hypothetical protein
MCSGSERVQDKNLYWPGGRRFVVAVILGQVENDEAFPSKFCGRKKSVLHTFRATL